MYLLATDSNGQLVGSIEITPEVQTIGRGAQCQLMITGHGVSRTHASVYLHERGVVVCDEGSANGVKVDGQLITAPTLVDEGNEIEISGFRLRVQTHPDLVAEPVAAVAPAAAPQPAMERDGEDTDEEFDTRLEVQSGAGAALASTRLTLVGRGGPYDGTVMNLDEVLCTVGRDDDNHVVLEDPSVSRRHAQIRLSALGDRVTVVDLRSSNGTFVEGERIKRAEVNAGSVVRFGDLGFKLEILRDSPGGKLGKGASKRKRLYIAAAGVFALLIGVGVVAYVKRPKPVVKRQLSPEELLRKRQAEVQALADSARRKIAQRAWSDAIVKLDEVLKKDPLNTEAKTQRQLALDELSNQKVFERGLKFFALGNRDNLLKAQTIFAKVPKKSIYARDTRYKLKTIAQRLAEDFRIKGVSRCKARYWKTCYSLLCKFFHTMPMDVAVPGEPGLRRRMARIERRYKRRRKFEKCKAPRYLRRPGEGPGKESPDEVLAGKYDNTRLRRLVKLYFDGKIDVALKLAAKDKKRRSMRPRLRELEKIVGQLLIIRGKYQEGFSFLRQRNAREADRTLALVLSADRALVPKKLESFYRKDVKRGLSKLYAELGEEDFKVKHYTDAFKLWKRGEDIDNTNATILNGLLQLEKVAETLVREGRTLAGQGKIVEARAKLTMARDIVKTGRSTRKDAEKALGQLGK
jgi:pSer/pThr/pTyr-binding forkhead associated (FHA) protein